MASYSLIPVDVEPVETKYRRIHTRLPVPESLPILEQLSASEPQSMQGQPPVIWHSADNVTVSDPWGNRWLDWSSGVLVANSGHGRAEIREALKELIDRPLLATYVFPHAQRAELTTVLQSLAPDPGNASVFLLTTGSEAVECCIKLARTYALEKYGPERNIIVSFDNAFHGRTLGSQLAGGMDKLKIWTGKNDPTFVQVPFPDDYKNEDTRFELFLESLDALRVAPDDIAGVVSETYQGVGPDFMPVEYAQKLEAFCREHDIVLCMDEVQAGFGRTGRMFCYQHYGITPDLVACGKGISSSLPLSAVIGRRDIMDLYPPGSMTSTHSASPLPVAAALANIKILQSENLAQNAADLEPILLDGLYRVQAQYPKRIGHVSGKGLVAGALVVKSGTKEPDADTATAISTACYHRGLLMFAPVGVAGECLKIAPPLTISEAALREGLEVLEESIAAVMG